MVERVALKSVINHAFSFLLRLKKDIDGLKDEKKSDDSSNSPTTPRSQRGASFSRNRPHSLHSDMFEGNKQGHAF